MVSCYHCSDQYQSGIRSSVVFTLHWLPPHPIPRYFNSDPSTPSTFPSFLPQKPTLLILLPSPSNQQLCFTNFIDKIKPGLAYDGEGGKSLLIMLCLPELSSVHFNISKVKPACRAAVNNEAGAGTGGMTGPQYCGVRQELRAKIFHQLLSPSNCNY